MLDYKNLDIILIEDNDGQALLIKKNLSRSGVKNKIILMKDGQQGVDFIFRKGTYKDIKRHNPMLILLDLNLPKVPGLQILKQVKQNTETRHIPIIVFTTSDDPGEIKKCYEYGCNFFLTKPVDYEEFSDTIQVIGSLIKIVQIPSYGVRE